LAAVAIVSVVAWAIATLADVYRYYGSPYGTYTAFGAPASTSPPRGRAGRDDRGGGWHRRRARVFVGGRPAGVPAISEVAYAIRYGGDDGYGWAASPFRCTRRHPAGRDGRGLVGVWDQRPGLGVAR
jgi:hypothetical protein